MINPSIYDECRHFRRLKLALFGLEFTYDPPILRAISLKQLLEILYQPIKFQ